MKENSHFPHCWLFVSTADSSNLVFDKQSTLHVPDPRVEKNVLLQPEAGDVLIKFQICASELGLLSLALALDQSRL